MQIATAPGSPVVGDLRGEFSVIYLIENLAFKEKQDYYF